MAGQLVECPKCGKRNDASAPTCAACGLGLPWALEHWGEHVSGPAEGYPPLILCSDDEAGLLSLFDLIFEAKGGYRVATSLDAYETLELAGRLRPDLITTDIMKPGMDGFEMIERLKANPVARDIPVLIITACAAYPVFRTTKPIGAAGYFIKPFLPRQLLATVRAILAGRTAFPDGKTVDCNPPRL